MIERAAFLKALLLATGGLDIWDPPDPELPAAPPSPAAARPPAGNVVRVQLADGSIAALDVEKYLYGVVPLETSPSWPAAALQAQAIVARTYALQKRTLSRAYDVLASDADQRITKAYDAILAAKPEYANRTSYVIAPNGKIIYEYTALSPDKHVENTMAAVAKWQAEHKT